MDAGGLELVVGHPDDGVRLFPSVSTEAGHPLLVHEDSDGYGVRPRVRFPPRRWHQHVARVNLRCLGWHEEINTDDGKQ